MVLMAFEVALNPERRISSVLWMNICLKAKGFPRSSWAVNVNPEELRLLLMHPEVLDAYKCLICNQTAAFITSFIYKCALHFANYLNGDTINLFYKLW